MLTLALEVPLYAALLKPRATAAVGGAAINLVSHPVAFLLVMPRLAPELDYFQALAVTETGVWILEALLLWLWLRRDPDLLGAAALIANAVSLAVGLAALS